MKTRADDMQAEALLAGTAASEPALAALLEQIRDAGHAGAPLPTGNLAVMLEHGLPVDAAGRG